MSSIAPLPQSSYAITILSGADKGVTYQLVAGQVSIGRNPDNTIVVSDDPKISRNHAVIVVGSHGAQISDVSGKNKVLVGSDEVTSRMLNPGDIIQLGETRFLFKNIAQLADAPKPESLGLNPSRRRNRPKSKMNFYILVGVIAVLFAWLLSSSVNKPAAVKLRTDSDAEMDINSNKEIVEAIQLANARDGRNSSQYKEAQPNFIKGFRDYRKGQYDRAIESFQACLSLFPSHPQCQRYLRLAEKKFHELLQYHMVLANKYKAQNQFAACKASYRNAMVMIKNPSDKIYIEAKSGHDACRALEGDRF
ncbi:MAG: FHA domain-containing protein [Bdellovibrionales bacterium]|nr:FHA domain-containing protein [Bdellovibrionales bacterium]